MVIALIMVAGCGMRPVVQSADSVVELQTLVGAVAMPDRFGTDAAAAVLEQGGNAVDAAIAASFVLAVTYPEAGNIGGGGFMLLHFEGERLFLDYRETAPARVHRDLYLDEHGAARNPQGTALGRGTETGRATGSRASTAAT